MKLERRQLQVLYMGTGLLAMASLEALGQSQQMPIGSVSLADATVTGSAATADDRAVLSGNGSITAKDHPAYVILFRGGSVRVCATSGLHLTSGTAPAEGSEASPPPLMLALDRGAMELRTTSVPSDVLMTPDLRFTFSEPGPLDLRIRVTRNGDTCVENRVAGLTNHPILHVNSLFGDEGYEVLPGQHVLFERANLHEVVDNESSPCGCPEESAKPAPAEVGAISLKPVPRVSSAQAAAQHPFPAAVSQGLAPPPEVPEAPPTVVHTQIATTLVYPAVPPDSSGKSASAPAKPATTPKPATPAKPGFFRGIGRFFKRIF